MTAAVQNHEDEVDDSAAATPNTTSKIRWLFLGVSAILLSLLLGSGFLAVRYFTAIHDQELAVTQRLNERARMLSGLWLSIQTYNDAVERFVKQTQASAALRQPSEQRLDQFAIEIDSELKRYPATLDPSEEELLSGLQDLFTQQRTVYIAALANKPAPQKQQQDLTAKQVAPLQSKILDWSGKIHAWNGERIQKADQALAAGLAGAERGLVKTLAIAFGSGFLLVLAGMAYIARLERQTHRRYLQLAHSQAELQRLSASLVDAQESERRSISRELHDEIGQSLGALLVDLGRLSGSAAGDPELKVQLENMKSVAERTFQAVRNVALLLRPSMLDDLGLVAALEWQGREVSRRSDVEVDVQSEDVSDTLPDEYRICIYRLVQEALNNAVRHSGAKNAKVTIRQSAKGVITVRVHDDGKGFDARHKRGLGLLGMEERVKRLAGTLTVESSPATGQGTTVTAELPLPKDMGGAQ